MTTLANLRIKCRTSYLKIDPNAKVWDDNILDYFLNEWKRQIQSDLLYDLPENQATQDYVLTPWVKEYDLPDRFIKVIWVLNNWKELRPSDKKNCMWEWQGIPSDYYLYWKKIGFYPTPSGWTTITLLYSQELNEMSTPIGTELPVDYDDAIVLWATYLMLMSVEKIDKANMVRNQYNNKKDMLFQRYYNDEDLSFNVVR